MARGSSIRLLRANRAFRSLWWSRSASYLGDAMGLVALLLHVADDGGEAAAVAALLLVGDLLPSLLSPLTGTVGDRVDIRRVLVACELAQAAVVGLLALLLPPLPVLLALVAVRALLGQVFQPASRAAVPALVADDDLEQANAAVGLGANGMEAVGPLLAAVLLPVLGVRGVLAVDAVSFVVSALLLRRLPPLPPEVVEDRPTFLADARAGLRHLRSSPIVRIVAGGFVAVALATGVDDVALVFLARDELGGSGSATALLYAAGGLGLIVGFGVLGGRARLPSPVVIAMAGFALSSGGNLLTGTAWAVGAAFAFQAVRGLGNAAMDVGVSTLVQREVPAELRSRVFGTVFGAVGVAAGGSYLLGAVLLEATSARTTFVVAGAAGLVAAAVCALAARRSLR